MTVIEVLPKDKKGKEEKTNVLGQSCIDLLPLLHGMSVYLSVCYHTVIQCVINYPIMMVYKRLNTVLCTATIQFFPDIIKSCELRLKKYTLKLHCSVKKRTENCVGS